MFLNNVKNCSRSTWSKEEFKNSQNKFSSVIKKAKVKPEKETILKININNKLNIVRSLLLRCKLNLI